MLSIFKNINCQNLVKCRIHPAYYLICLSKGMKTIQLKTQNSMCTFPYGAKKDEFLSSFSDIVHELKDKISLYDPNAAEHYARVLQYNIPRHETFRSASTLHAYKLIAPKAALTEKNIKLCVYLEWCFQLYESTFNMLDDIMDGDSTRKGRPCWYKLPDIQMSAINDGILIEATIYQILKEHFSHLDCYTKLVEHFHDFTLISAIAQYLDTKSMKEDVLTFTMEQYNAIATHKGSYSFYNPIAGALHLIGCTNPETLNQVKMIFFKLGYFAQVQNDFLDCFGDPELFGKIGTDIEGGRCTWLTVMCLQRATDAQKEVLKECYGKKDPECIRRVKQLYEELSLPNLYATFEEDSYNNIRILVEKTAESSEIPSEVYLQIMRELFRRQM